MHYTTLLHLTRVFELRRRRIRDRDSFLEASVRLDAATDTAFELLGRCLLDRGAKPAWDENAGKKWEVHVGGPFKSLAQYRNALLHGRVRPEHEVSFQLGDLSTKVPFYPTFDTVLKALDWREAALSDAAPANHLTLNDIPGFGTRTLHPRALAARRVGPTLLPRPKQAPVSRSSPSPGPK